MSQETDIELKNHEYDGIKEYDNPLPGWWLLTFFGTIIFAFLYVVHYESGSGPTLAEELKTAMSEIQILKATQKNDFTESEDELFKKGQEPQSLAQGQEVFAGKCASCHGNELQGLVGPNLVDSYWIHGKGKMLDLLTTIKSGVLDKGMPPWENILKKEEMIAVAGFIMSKKGSQPVNSKAPQGELIQ